MNNETVVEEVPFIVLHKAVIVEASTEIALDSTNSTEVVETTEVNIDHGTTSNFTTTEEKEVSNEPTTIVHVQTDSHTTTMTPMETTVESTTMELITSTSFIPADCPILKDCPFDNCAFARKLDNRGCPTCNCHQSNKSNITCPPLTCPGCLYGHYTDPNGVNLSSIISISFISYV